jgi:hypothetical protein
MGIDSVQGTFRMDSGQHLCFVLAEAMMDEQPVEDFQHLLVRNPDHRIKLRKYFKLRENFS